MEDPSDYSEDLTTYIKKEKKYVKLISKKEMRLEIWSDIS